MSKIVETTSRTGFGLNPVAALIDGATPATSINRAGDGFNPIAALIAGVLHTGATLYTWQQRANERAALGNLDDRLLQDIGLDRASASMEATKPFWKR